MQAVILVGGEGTRLRPLTHVTPKPMVPLFGVPFLERTLWRLKEAGVDDVILAAGYLPSAITDHLGDGSSLGMKLTYVIEDEPRGTAGAIRNVADHITGPFFVLNGDVLTSLDLKAMMDFHKTKGGLGALHLIKVEDPSPFGCVVHDENGRVTRFVEKPPKNEAPTDEINAGTYLLERDVLEIIPPGKNVSIERETFPQLLASGAQLYAYATTNYWLDVGRPDQYIQAHRDVLDGKLKLQVAGDEKSHKAGKFWLRGDAGMPKGIQPPVFIGADATIDEGADVGPYTVIGERARIGRGACVKGTILWNDVVVYSNASIVDSILASNVRVGEDARIGAGTVIAHDAAIEPGTDLPADSRVVAAEAP